MRRSPLKRKTPLRPRPRADRDVKPGKMLRLRAPLPGEYRGSLPTSFLEKFSKDEATGCWVWIADKTRLGGGVGYGRFSVRGSDGVGKKVRAHRFAYEALVGPIPSGLQLDHLCRNRACVNPAHLEPVTARENTLRSHGVTARNAIKTHCKMGHPLEGDNVGTQRRGRPVGRFCRTCQRRFDKQSKERRRIRDRARASDEAYLERVRRMPCRAQGMGTTPCRGGIEAHHAGRRPGVGMKCHDHETHAFCMVHHAEWHGLYGAFKGWTKRRRREWADEQIQITQGICQTGFDEAEDRLAEAREWPTPIDQGIE